MREPHAELDELARRVIGAAIRVHKQLLAGFPESVYGNALAIELSNEGLTFQREYPVAVVYDGQVVGEGRVDFFVEGRLVVELKAVEAITNVHMGQVISYLKMVKEPLGLILNFRVARMKDGVHRVVYSDM